MIPKIGDLVTDPSEKGAYGIVLDYVNEHIVREKAKLIAKIYWISGRWQGEKIGLSVNHVHTI